MKMSEVVTRLYTLRLDADTGHLNTDEVCIELLDLVLEIADSLEDERA